MYHLRSAASAMLCLLHSLTYLSDREQQTKCDCNPLNLVVAFAVQITEIYEVFQFNHNVVTRHQVEGNFAIYTVTLSGQPRL